MNTANLKTALQYFPEVSLLLFSIGWTIGSINYVAMVLIAVVSILLFCKNRILAFVLSILLGFGSLWMIGAVLSEYREFPLGDPAGTKLLLTGSLLFLFTLAMSIVMPFKYFSRK